MNQSLTADKKKRILLIAICVIAFIIIILFIFRLVLSKHGESNKTNVNNRERLNGVYILSDQAPREVYALGTVCLEDNSLCIYSMEFYYYKKTPQNGIIRYFIRNETEDEIPAGKLRVEVEGYKLVFPFDALAAGETFEGVYGYDDYNFDFSSNFSQYTFYYSGTGDQNTMYETFDNDAKESIVVN